MHRQLTPRLLQSLVLASLFAWMEGLFAVGYRPKLQAELDTRVRAALAEHAAKQEALLAQPAGEEAK